MDLPVLAERILKDLPRLDGEYAPRHQPSTIKCTLHGRKYIKYLVVRAGKMTFGGYIDPSQVDLNTLEFEDYLSVNFRIYGVRIKPSSRYEEPIDLGEAQESTPGRDLKMRRAAFYMELLDEANISERDSTKSVDELLEHIRLVKLTRNTDMFNMLKKQDRETLLQKEIDELKERTSDLQTKLAAAEKRIEERATLIGDLEDTRESYKIDLKKCIIATIDKFEK